jgi:hypothetical protein
MRAVTLEDGKVLFKMREAKYKLAIEHGSFGPAYARGD